MQLSAPFVRSSTPVLRTRSTPPRKPSAPPTLADVARLVRSHLALASRPVTNSDFIRVRDALSRLCGRHARHYDPELYWTGVRAFVRASGLTTFVRKESPAAEILAAHVADGAGPVRFTTAGCPRPLHSHFNRLAEYADVV